MLSGQRIVIYKRLAKTIVESPLVVGASCSWTSWVSLTHTNLLPHERLTFCIIKQQNKPNPPNNVPRTSKILPIHKHWPPRTRMIPQYIKCYFYSFI